MSPEKLLREARHAAGLTQAQLAERMGTTQSAVARLESPGANPRVENLERALLAAGHRLEIRAEPTPQPLDETLIASNLKRTPAERLAELEALDRFARRIGGRARAGA
jgi:transcriptional regulator with XRE-family HTH domain